MKQIAIIPAKGTSKRLPRKNILPVKGKPMISYPIKIAKKCGLFDDIVVSTDDNEIKNIAIDNGASIIERPISLSQDRSTVAQVCEHILSLNKYKNVKIFCCIYATAVLLKPSDLINSRSMLDDSPKADFIMGVSHYNYHPVQALIQNDEYLTPMLPDYQNIQSQFYPDVVVSNGTLYWARVDAFTTVKSFYGNQLKGYLMPDNKALDINTIDDYNKLITMLADSYCNI